MATTSLSWCLFLGILHLSPPPSPLFTPFLLAFLSHHWKHSLYDLNVRVVLSNNPCNYDEITILLNWFKHFIWFFIYFCWILLTFTRLWKSWHIFYLGTPHTYTFDPFPLLIPSRLYLFLHFFYISLLVHISTWHYLSSHSFILILVSICGGLITPMFLITS